MIENLHAALRLNEAYQEQYRITKDKLSTQPKVKQFDFNESEIFGKFDLFCKRIQKLIDMFTTVQQVPSPASCAFCVSSVGLASFVLCVGHLWRAASSMHVLFALRFASASPICSTARFLCGCVCSFITFVVYLVCVYLHMYVVCF